jgi:hypothetical protein
VNDRPLTVALDPGDAHLARRHQTVLASLPARFRIAQDQSAGMRAGGKPAADVVVISGDQPTWRQRAMDAITGRVPAVVLSGFSAMTVAGLTQVAVAANQAGVLAVADLAYASVRSWADALPSLAGDLAGSAVLDCVITAPPPGPGELNPAALRSALVEQLALVRPFLGGPLRLEALHLGARDYVLATQQSELAVTLSGSLSAVAGHRLEFSLVGAERRWQARFAVDALAAPVSISAWDASGKRTWPPRYESGYRETWLRLHTVMAGQEVAVFHGAAQLASDLAAAQAVLSQILV